MTKKKNDGEGRVFKRAESGRNKQKLGNKGNNFVIEKGLRKKGGGRFDPPVRSPANQPPPPTHTHTHTHTHTKLAWNVLFTGTDEKRRHTDLGAGGGGRGEVGANLFLSAGP